jgi:hypothetical protein
MRRFWSFLVAGIAIVGCANGDSTSANDDDDGGGDNDATSGGDGSTDGVSPMPDAALPGVGQPCPNGVCSVGECTMVGGKSYCTVDCPPSCPNGTYCAIINGGTMCVPDLGQECAKCTQQSDCPLTSDACLTAPLGDQFCAQDCTTDGLCAAGFTCVDMGSYANPDGGVGDAGDMSDAGAAGDAGTMAPSKWCVPTGGASCPCDPKRDGVTNGCANTNTNGSCPGTETCTGATSTWSACSGQTPAAETCNGMDDNCNGMTDEGDPNVLCASQGPVPLHASWACTNGMCGLGACDAGWTAFPSGNGTTGCACQVDAAEPNDFCVTAKDEGMLTDVAGVPLVIQGTLSSATDVDVFKFESADIAESGTNSYHVSLSFTQPSPNNEFVMDVMRSPVCSDTPTGAGVAITSYDYCVNGSGPGPIGEGPCGPTTPNVPHCADHSSQYYVRVYRNSTASPTCSAYQITITGGGGSCDFSGQCM